MAINEPTAPPKLNTKISVLLQKSDHRPWPMPEGPWVMTQTWRNLLFAHWPLPPEVMRPLVPACFELDTFEGQAWIGIVPFRMTDIRLRFMPTVPYTDRFPELNVRTYVTLKGKAGVYFFSLDAANALAVMTARRWFNLPYFNADMSCIENEGQVQYFSDRTHRNASPARLVGTYQPLSDIYQSQPDSLDYWLTERYCLFTTDRRGRPYRGDIHHLPWPLQPAAAYFTDNTMAAVHHIPLPTADPLLHYAHYLKVLIWPLQRII